LVNSFSFRDEQDTVLPFGLLAHHLTPSEEMVPRQGLGDSTNCPWSMLWVATRKMSRETDG
jgi:hypothetical protein